MTPGEVLMPLLCVDNWATPLELQWLSAMLTLVLVLAQSTWEMFIAVAVRATSLTAPIALLSTVTEDITRMLE